MLEIRNLTKIYNGPQGIVRALEDVSLTVAAGEFVAVQGPSGCGKSTLLLAAGGLLVPNDGWVSVDGQDLYAMSFDRRARLRAAAIGFVFQQFHLVPYLSVLENVLAPSLAMPSPNAQMVLPIMLLEMSTKRSMSSTLPRPSHTLRRTS